MISPALATAQSDQNNLEYFSTSWTISLLELSLRLVGSGGRCARSDRGPFAEALALSCRLIVGPDPDPVRGTGDGEFREPILGPGAEAFGGLDALRDEGLRADDADIDRRYSVPE